MEYSTPLIILKLEKNVRETMIQLNDLRKSYGNYVAAEGWYDFHRMIGAAAAILIRRRWREGAASKPNHPKGGTYGCHG
jgi:hypothetical protein